MPTQAEKAQAFRALHARPCAFIIPNPWDIGSARILAHLGFEALATTSMGQAFALGRQDNSLDRAETLAYASLIVSRTNLPRSGCRCSLCPGAGHQEGHRDGGRFPGSSRERGHGARRGAIEPRRAFRDRRPPNQRGQLPLSHRTGCRPARRTGNVRAGYIYFRKRSGESPGAQPHFRRKRLGKLLYPDAAGGGLAEMHRLSVHAQRHGLVVLAL